VKQAQTAAGGGKRMLAEPKGKVPTPRSLKRRVRSMATYFEQQTAKMGGTSGFSAELRAVEEYREVVDELVSLRDLLNRILEELEIEGDKWQPDSGPGD
jgi:di/tripeptidase